MTIGVHVPKHIGRPILSIHLTTKFTEVMANPAVLLSVLLVALLVQLLIDASFSAIIGDVLYWSPSMSSLSNLDFKPGLEFQDLVYDRFGPFAHVSSPNPSEDFFLVVSFAQSAIRLDSDSVAIILQSVIGG